MLCAFFSHCFKSFCRRASHSSVCAAVYFFKSFAINDASFPLYLPSTLSTFFTFSGACSVQILITSARKSTGSSAARVFPVAFSIDAMSDSKSRPLSPSFVRVVLSDAEDTMMVGKLVTETILCSFAVASILAMTTLGSPAKASPTCSHSGASFLQCPHHGA